MNRVLVTGALGNVGREVARECALHGFTTCVADLDGSALDERFPAMAKVRLDFLDRSTWASSLTDCDLVFLLRPPPIGDMEHTLCPFVTAAYAAGVTHIVFLAVAGADRMKWVPHRKVELHLESTGTAWTVLRPGFFAQNLQDAYRRDIVEDDRIYVPAKRGRVAFVDVRDVAAVAARVFQEPSAFRGQALTLTGPEALTFDAVAKLLSSTLARSIRYVDASIPAYAWHLLRTRHMPWVQIAIQTILHVGLRRGDAEKVELTIERILGSKPRAISAYIRDAAATWNARSVDCAVASTKQLATQSLGSSLLAGYVASALQTSAGSWVRSGRAERSARSDLPRGDDQQCLGRIADRAHLGVFVDRIGAVRERRNPYAVSSDGSGGSAAEAPSAMTSPTAP